MGTNFAKCIITKMVDKDTYFQPRQEPTDKQKTLLMEEVGNRCPLCGRSIVSYKPNATTRRFEVAHVYPNRPTESELKILNGVPRLGESSEDIKNKIALCVRCHKEYDSKKTVESYMKLYHIKAIGSNKISAKHMLANENIEEELVGIIRKLDTLSPTELKKEKKLPEKVLTIKQKISDEKWLLQQKVTANVTSYFSYIRNTFRGQGFSTNQYELIRMRMHFVYKEAKLQDLEADAIFDVLTDWLMSKTQASREACEIMVSYFVQNCDIYGEDSK